MNAVGCRPFAIDLAYALAGVDVPVRYVVATALQLGIASGVGLMLVLQTRVALRDDREATWRR